MKSTAIFYGSTRGNAKHLAELIAEKINVQTFDVADSPSAELSNFDNLILGTSTIGFGQVPKNWKKFIPELEKSDLNGKTIAIFGVGNSLKYADSFVGSMAGLYKTVKDKGYTLVDAADPDGYKFEKSEFVVDGKFVVLPINKDNEAGKTGERVDNLPEVLKESF